MTTAPQGNPAQPPPDPPDFISRMFGHLLGPTDQQTMQSAIPVVAQQLNPAQHLWLGLSLGFNRLYELRRVSALLEVLTNTMTKGFTTGYENQQLLANSISDQARALDGLTAEIKSLNRNNVDGTKAVVKQLKGMRRQLDELAALVESGGGLVDDDDPDDGVSDDPPAPSDDEVVWEDDPDPDAPASSAPPTLTGEEFSDDDDDDDDDEPKTRPGESFSHPVR